jgi:quinol-cytochrome oxidoreductase complex cytochrome b subunit
MFTDIFFLLGLPAAASLVAVQYYHPAHVIAIGLWFVFGLMVLSWLGRNLPSLEYAWLCVVIAIMLFHFNAVARKDIRRLLSRLKKTNA